MGLDEGFHQEFDIGALRRRAESRIDRCSVSGDRLDQLNHELAVHGIELEMQNEELRRTQQALEESLQNYQASMDALPMGHLMLDAGGQISQVNSKAAGLLGRSRSQLRGTHVQGLLSQADADTLHIHLRDCLASGSPREFTLSYQQGEHVILLLLQLMPTSWPGAAATPACCVFIKDLSPELETRTRQRAREAALVSKLATATVRNFEGLLTAAAVTSDRLGRKEAGPKSLREAKIIREALGRARAFSVRLRGVAGREHPTSGAPRSVVECVRGAISLLSDLLDESITFVVDPSVGKSAQVAHPSELQRIIFEALAPTIGENKPGAQVALHRVPPGDPCLQGRAESAGGYVCIALARLGLDELANSGEHPPGGASCEHELARTSAFRAMQAQVQESCAGFVRLGPQGESGSWLDLYIPIAEADAPESSRPSAIAATAAPKKIILLVDDEHLVLSSIAGLLRISDYEVITARSGVEALEVARSDQHLDMLITDVRMPGMNGPELAAAVARLRPDLPRIYLSGDLGDISLEEGALLLSKPFAPDKLIAALEVTLETQ